MEPTSKIRTRLGALVAKRALLVMAALVVALAAAGGGAYALTASAAPSAPGTPAALSTLASAVGSPGAPPSSPATPKATVGSALVRRITALALHAIHAQVTVDQKGTFVTYSLDRGTVGAVSSSSITVDEANHAAVTDAVAPSTRVLPKKVGGITKVHQGAHVIVLAKSGTALAVVVPAKLGTRVRGLASNVSSSSITITPASGTPVTLVVTPATRVLPASLGGITKIPSGATVVALDRGGKAILITVPAARSSASRAGSLPGGGSGVSTAA